MRRPATVARTAAFASWSATLNATATLVSTSNSGSDSPDPTRVSPLAGVTEGLDVLMAHRPARRGDDQQPILFVKFVTGSGTHPKIGPIGLDIDDALAQAQSVAQDLRDNQASGTIDGCLHVWNLPTGPPASPGP